MLHKSFVFFGNKIFHCDEANKIKQLIHSRQFNYIHLLYTHSHKYHYTQNTQLVNEETNKKIIFHLLNS